MRLLPLVFLLALPASAGDAPKTRASDEKNPAVLAVKERLTGDQGATDALADRLLNSRLGGMLSTERDAGTRLAAIKDWIANDPDSAARLAIGLASDEKNGNTLFEDSLFRQSRTTYEDNPGAKKNVFGRLTKAAKDSSLIKKQTDEMGEDERRELLRTLFEGKGAQSERVITQKDGGKSSTEKPAAGPATAFSGYYDRLSGGNLRGYSPQLLSLQSALNSRRPPGAPHLVETGKLDYATLSYPGHGMRYDLGNLDERLRRERIIQLARLAGQTLTARDWKDPDLEAKLRAKAPADKFSPRLARRAALLDRARKAVADFDAAAAQSKDANAITKGLLVELGRDQKEASRWIAAAALEEELSRLESEEGLLSAELLAVIDAVPASPTQRAAYKKRGEALKAKYAQAKANALKAQGLLESPAWAASLAEVDRLVAENQSLRRNLLRDVDMFARVPWRIRESLVVQPRWREVLDGLALKWAPGTAFARAVAVRRNRLSRYLGVFAQVAAGDLDAAARSFSCAEPLRH
ncbi:MAG: hypothetical protein AAB262_12755 [Elusimicrobiota bacterium]